MIRLRRYRIFLAVAVFCLLALYYVSDTNNWSSSISAESLKNFGTRKSLAQASGDRPSRAGGLKDEAQAPALDRDGARPLKDSPQKDAQSKEDFPQIKLPGEEAKETTAETTRPTPVESATNLDVATKSTASAEDGSALITPVASTPSPSTRSATHWVKQSEFFPVPSASIIPLPTGRSARIPRVQAHFPRETVPDRRAREEKLERIRDTFLKHWRGYKTYAWDHDELKPVSGTFKDPFAGWRATLVDTLDTLWIMGLKDEFDEAAKAVGTIDFTTCNRVTIPLFEVAIRYMGGLLAAYDISEHKYPVLLQKVVELGELLMSAFDTPNRMPITHFSWQPEAQSRPRVSTSGVVLAEIGSLSVEFARLAQVTGNNKYYDAIARITNEFEAWQNHTKLPGLFPLWLDVSGGCLLSDVVEAHSSSKGPSPQPPEDYPSLDEVNKESVGGRASEQLQEKDRNTFGTDRVDVKEEVKPIAQTQIAQKDDNTFGTDRVDEERKRSRAQGGSQNRDPKTPNEHSSLRKRQADRPFDDCVKSGFKTQFSFDRFTLGGMADSVYEYFPKAFLVLGGRNRQYRKMHEIAMDATKNRLLYRAMIPERERHLVFSGALSTDGSVNETTGGTLGFFNPESGHLECFAGAMFGLGGQIFDRPEDVEIGEHLTDGCIWAYEQMATGIMPENLSPVPCTDSYDAPCRWNESRWYDAIDPHAVDNVAMNKKFAEEQRAKAVQASEDMGTPFETGPARSSDTHSHNLDKRQLDDSDMNNPNEAPATVPDRTNRPGSVSGSGRGRTQADLAAQNVASTETDFSRRPPPSTTTDATDSTLPEAMDPGPTDIRTYMNTRIDDARLKPGISKIGSRAYVLRPEAIESVFYMYRITGKSYYREKGWNMFRAIVAATETTYGNSAVGDVTSRAPNLADSAESFWLGETLKYFYLLFDTEEGEGSVSLDEWVFSTEAHPFRRGDWSGEGGYDGDEASRKIAKDVVDRIEGRTTSPPSGDSARRPASQPPTRESAEKERPHAGTAAGTGAGRINDKDARPPRLEDGVEHEKPYAGTAAGSGAGRDAKSGGGTGVRLGGADDTYASRPQRDSAKEFSAGRKAEVVGSEKGSASANGRSAGRQSKERDGVED